MSKIYYYSKHKALLDYFRTLMGHEVVQEVYAEHVYGFDPKEPKYTDLAGRWNFNHRYDEEIHSGNGINIDDYDVRIELVNGKVFTGEMAKCFRPSEVPGEDELVQLDWTLMDLHIEEQPILLRLPLYCNYEFFVNRLIRTFTAPTKTRRFIIEWENDSAPWGHYVFEESDGALKPLRNYLYNPRKPYDGPSSGSYEWTNCPHEWVRYKTPPGGRLMNGWLETPDGWIPPQ